MKTNLLTTTLLLASIALFAQEDKNKVFYLDSLNITTTEKDYAFTRVVEDYSAKKNLYAVSEYYKSGKIRMSATSKNKNNLQLEGLRIDYYENGNKKQESNYVDNKLSGKLFSWYENNVRKSEKEATWDAKNKTTQIKVLQFWNPEGNQTVIDGNGQMEETSENHSDSGSIKNGLKEGTWQGTYNKKCKYIEKYNQGEMISGISTDKNNIEYKYDVLESKPEPIKGIQHFYQFIGKNFKVPNEYKSLKGIIHTKFIVDKDGKIIEAKNTKSLNKTLDEEAIRVISSYEKWIPAKQRGQYVKVLYTIPIAISGSK